MVADIPTDLGRPFTRLSADDFDAHVKKLRDGIDEFIGLAGQHDHQAFLSVYPSILNLVRGYREMDKAPLPKEET